MVHEGIAELIVIMQMIVGKIPEAEEMTKRTLESQARVMMAVEALLKKIVKPKKRKNEEENLQVLQEPLFDLS